MYSYMQHSLSVINCMSVKFLPTLPWTNQSEPLISAELLESAVKFPLFMFTNDKWRCAENAPTQDLVSYSFGIFTRKSVGIILTVASL